jgi:hypothetical protein
MSKDDLKNNAKNILKYLELGERKEIDKKNIASVGYWYSLPINDYKAKIIIPEAFNIIFLTHYCPLNPVVDQRFNIVKVDKPELEKALLGYLNSSFFWLVCEVIGRTNLGEGALDFPSSDMNQSYILNFDTLSKAVVKKIEQITDKMMNRTMGTVFEEIGAYNPEEVNLDKVKPDRRNLDQIIMGEILGLSDEKQFEIYRSIIDLVKARIQRSQTFNKKNKTTKQYQLDDVTNNIVNRIRDGL